MGGGGGAVGGGAGGGGGSGPIIRGLGWIAATWVGVALTGAGAEANWNRLRDPPCISTDCTFASKSVLSVGSIVALLGRSSGRGFSVGWNSCEAPRTGTLARRMLGAACAGDDAAGALIAPNDGAGVFLVSVSGPDS